MFNNSRKILHFITNRYGVKVELTKKLKQENWTILEKINNWDYF